MARPPTTERWPASNGLASIEEAVGAFSLLRDFFEGAIIVDADTHITWMDARYRELLKLNPSFDPIGLPVEDVIPHSLLRRVVETGRPILLDIMNFNERQFVVCRIPLKDASGAVEGAIGFVFYDNVDYLAPILDKFETLHKQLTRAQAALTRERQTKYSLSSFVGQSEAVRELKAMVRRFALRDGAALILGETGTGKELLAHAIHQQSDRADGPFVAVNIAAVPEALLEAEFFGVAPGAYTGADKKPRKGKFELAHGGTLFLDEIGDMPPAIQAKFLRVLQEGEVEALGSNTVKKIDVRIIAATSQDLEAKVADKSFRADLYYRIAVLTVHVPPLRDRREDIALICEVLLEQTMRAADERGWVITPEAVALLQNHDWPGNVRELRNVLERAAALAPSEVLDGAVISRAMPPGAARSMITSTSGQALAHTIADTERQAIIDALATTGGQKSAAALRLGVSRSQFYEKLKRYNIDI
ncbi:sigma 54-interacting transcriptional regulator [Devosia neptuniae]|uniref:sigma-54 interaction domain-containing protein n=1 Tax=Devosia neptuniae TaxID=191302 RepID=UPI0022AF0A99|nr:sigma 54-interacting transcriptional regulator [Devosia neptuniae]MCZ4346779.1 sigma 54-interacting transcriptional regulator [Devosia neptuniae]|tara:strand:+ start:25066 stop:26490 length:1425 start_codon:yes stop_codon:yes gene_type:complete